jgi:S1-C subfamily serine protease
LFSVISFVLFSFYTAGNSGGPVLSKEGKLIGIAFQSLEGAENMVFSTSFEKGKTLIRFLSLPHSLPSN